MSIEGVYGPRKLRALERQLGVPIFRAAAWSPTNVDISLRDVHKHLRYNPKTGETADAECGGYDSCKRWAAQP